MHSVAPTIMTVAPSSRNNLAASSPRPEVPPVTRTILFMIFSWSEGFEFVAGACAHNRRPIRKAPMLRQPRLRQAVDNALKFSRVLVRQDARALAQQELRINLE